MPLPITEQDFENLIESLLNNLKAFWERLTPEQQRELISVYVGLCDALVALKAGGLAGARANLIGVLEKIRELLAGLMRLGGSEALKVRLQLITNTIQQFMKALGGETAVGGGATATAGGGTSITIGSVTVTGITAVTVAALLIELIVIFIGLYLWWDYCEKQAGTAPLPYGGRPCGNGKPVATNLSDWDISYGAVRSWNNLMEAVRKTAATSKCPAGSCPAGKTCTGSPAIQTWSQTRLGFATYSSCTFDVYCECL